MKKVDVLCIEDNEDFLLFLSHAFSGLEHKVSYHLERTGRDALKALGPDGDPEFQPRMILLDLNLPGLSGFDVLKEIRSSHRWRDIPVIVLTSSNDPKDIDHATMMGANAYLCKPNGLRELRTVLGTTCTFWLEHHARKNPWN